MLFYCWDLYRSIYYCIFEDNQLWFVQILPQYYIKQLGSIEGNDKAWSTDFDIFKYMCNIWWAWEDAHNRRNSSGSKPFEFLVHFQFNNFTCYVFSFILYLFFLGCVCVWEFKSLQMKTIVVFSILFCCCRFLSIHMVKLRRCQKI